MFTGTPSKRGFLRSGTPWLIFSAVFMGISVALTLSIARGGMDNWDGNIVKDLITIGSYKRSILWSYFYNTGSIWGSLLIAVGCLIIPKARQRYGIPLAACVGISVLLSFILGSVFERPRPEVEGALITATGSSFPNMESMVWMCIFIYFYASLWYFGRRDYPEAKRVPKYELDYLEQTRGSLPLATRGMMMIGAMTVGVFPPFAHVMLLTNNPIDIIVSVTYAIGIATLVMSFIVSRGYGLRDDIPGYENSLR